MFLPWKVPIFPICQYGTEVSTSKRNRRNPFGTKGCTSIQGQALYVRSARLTARTIEVRAVLRYFVPNKGLHPLRRFAAIPADFAIGAIC